MHVILSEIIRISLTEKFIQMQSDIFNLVRLGIKKIKSIDLHHHIKTRHLILRKPLPNHIIHKQDLSITMINKIMNISRLELVKNRNRNRTISQSGKKTNTPIGLIP